MAREAIVEEHIAPVQVLESDGSGVFRFEAIVSEADFVNRNKRIYPEQVLFPAFDRLNERIARNLAEPGLVDHPRPFEGASISNVGILWERFFFEGKLVKGQGRIVSTARGRDLQAAMEAGVPVGFSTRGWADMDDTEMDGETIHTVRELELTTIDAVTDPSVRHARVLRFSKEEAETMARDLENVQAELTAATERVAALEAREGEYQTRIAELEAAAVAEQTQLQNRVTELEVQLEEARSRIGELEVEKTEADVQNKLNELTVEHRFGATIRAKVAEMRKSGLTVTLDNLESVVQMFRELVEAAGSAANDGLPKGDLSTEEDIEHDADADELTEEQMAELRAAGLL